VLVPEDVVLVVSAGEVLPTGLELRPTAGSDDLGNMLGLLNMASPD
jgi:hypothetical protein